MKGWSDKSKIWCRTKNQLRVAIECHKGVKVKVVKWGFKKWNQHILVYIYAKQCEIQQKKVDEKAQTAKLTVFAMGSQLRVAKNLEN